MVKECMLSTGEGHLRALPRKSVVRITEHPDMTSAVYHGRKASNQTKKQTKQGLFFLCSTDTEEKRHRCARLLNNI